VGVKNKVQKTRLGALNVYWAFTILGVGWLVEV